MADEFIFTSESVSEGHPDKMADQVSDAILDAILAEDPHARVACETLFKTGMAIIAGEITTTALPDYEQVIRRTINDIGYTGSEMGFDWLWVNTPQTAFGAGVNVGDRIGGGPGIFLEWSSKD